jgi:D-apionolactonase
MLTRYALYNGRDTAPAERIPLRAGPWEMLFEQSDLRAVRLNGQEILRRVYVAVRDRNWDTIPAQISNLSLEIEENAFTISYDVENRRGEIDFFWHGSLNGTSDGRITFAMDGTARSSFEKNRIGFCVLFPAASSGQPALIEHTDGALEEAVFPVDICADQPVRPFENIRAVTLPLTPAGEVGIRFEGDVFEMEDQRLWTDASYKVFCIPLALPYPVKICAETRVFQEIELVSRLPETGALNTHSGPGPGASKPLVFNQPPDSAWRPLPLLGLGMASHERPLSANEIERLRALNLDHLRVDLVLADEGYPRRLEQAAGEAAALGVGLETAVMISRQQADEELRDLRSRLDALQPPISSWLIYPEREFFGGGPSIDPLVQAARRLLQDVSPGTPFCAGTNTDFVFLKRTPVPIAMIERICIALNPQVHAFDDLSLLETLEAQPMVVASARRMGAGLPVVVSPVTLKPRFNAYAAGAQPAAPPGVLPAQVDPRQRSLFGAGWTLGSLRGMLSGEALSTTYYETTGWRGVMECEAGSPWPAGYPSLAGVVFPLYHVLADVGEFAGGLAVPLKVGDGQSEDARASALALRLGRKMTILIANHNYEPLRVEFKLPGGDWKMRVLDETNAEIAMRSPETYRHEFFTALTTPNVDIRPLGLVRLDGWV